MRVQRVKYYKMDEKKKVGLLSHPKPSGERTSEKKVRYPEKTGLGLNWWASFKTGNPERKPKTAA